MKLRRVRLSDIVKNQQHTDVAKVTETHDITCLKSQQEKKRNKKWIPRRTSAGKERAEETKKEQLEK